MLDLEIFRASSLLSQSHWRCECNFKQLRLLGRAPPRYLSSLSKPLFTLRCFQKTLWELGNESIFLPKPITWTSCLAIFRDACECRLHPALLFQGLDSLELPMLTVTGGSWRRAQTHALSHSLRAPALLTPKHLSYTEADAH